MLGVMAMKFMKAAVAALAGAAALACAGAASAATYLFDSVGDSYTIDFNGSESGTVYPGLTAEIVYTLTGLSGNTATFSYTLDNTSTAPVTTSRVTSFGFDVDPNFNSVGTVTGTTFPTASSGNVPNGIGNVEFCLTAGSNCAGGGGGGEGIPGAIATGTFQLNFNTLPSSVTLSDLYVRYQGVNTIDGGSATGVPVTTTSAVPEPAVWAMMLVGFGGLGAMLRYRRRETFAAA